MQGKWANCRIFEAAQAKGVPQVSVAQLFPGKRNQFALFICSGEPSKQIHGNTMPLNNREKSASAVSGMKPSRLKLVSQAEYPSSWQMVRRSPLVLVTCNRCCHKHHFPTPRIVPLASRGPILWSFNRPKRTPASHPTCEAREVLGLTSPSEFNDCR